MNKPQKDQFFITKNLNGKFESIIKFHVEGEKNYWFTGSFRGMSHGLHQTLTPDDFFDKTKYTAIPKKDFEKFCKNEIIQNINVGDEISISKEDLPESSLSTSSLNNMDLSKIKVEGFHSSIYEHRILIKATNGHGWGRLGSNSRVSGINESEIPKNQWYWINPKSLSSVNLKQKKEVNMSNKFMDMTKQDAKDAAWRVGATQTTNLTKKAILALLKKQGVNKAGINVMKDILESDVGDVVLALSAGYGLHYLPTIGDDPRAQRLAKELRIHGMAKAGNDAVEMLAGALLPEFNTVFESLPMIEEKKTPEKQADLIEEEELVELSARKTA